MFELEIIIRHRGGEVSFLCVKIPILLDKPLPETLRMSQCVMSFEVLEKTPSRMGVSFSGSAGFLERAASVGRGRSIFPSELELSESESSPSHCPIF